MPSAAWEPEAAHWIAWARTPGHDAYWLYRASFFCDIVPEPGTRTLELGCGEGRVARDLAARGHRVVALDLAPSLVGAAYERGAAGAYLLADAVRPPFPDGSFDVVVAYNSLMDIDEMAAAVRDVGRVLVAGGSFCVSVTHPMSDAGEFSEERGAFEIRASYLRSGPFEGAFTRDGLTMTFRGWTHLLEDYARALEEAGLCIVRLREPPPPPAAPDEYQKRRHIPLFLQLRAVRAPT